MKDLLSKAYEPDLTKLHDLQPGTAVNLVLSGGGEKGIAHVVLLEKLEELGVKINSISASSAGALVGSMYASGLSTKDIYQFFVETDVIQLSWFTLLKPGIFNTNQYATFLKDRIKPTFEELKIPLFVAATDMEDNHVRYFNSGDLINPVLASCAIPGIFNPIKIAGKIYSDGGVMDNFPIEPFKDSELKIIGSYLSQPKTTTHHELNSTLKVATHAAKLKMHANELHKLSKTYLTLCFPVEQFSGFSKKVADDIYKTAKKYIEKV